MNDGLGECKICRRGVTMPVAANCGHIFCDSCLGGVVALQGPRPPCPDCREGLTSAEQLIGEDGGEPFRCSFNRVVFTFLIGEGNLLSFLTRVLLIPKDKIKLVSAGQLLTPERAQALTRATPETVVFVVGTPDPTLSLDSRIASSSASSIPPSPSSLLSPPPSSSPAPQTHHIPTSNTFMRGSANVGGAAMMGSAPPPAVAPGVTAAPSYPGAPPLGARPYAVPHPAPNTGRAGGWFQIPSLSSITSGFSLLLSAAMLFAMTIVKPEQTMTPEELASYGPHARRTVRPADIQRRAQAPPRAPWGGGGQIGRG